MTFHQIVRKKQQLKMMFLKMTGILKQLISSIGEKQTIQNSDPGTISKLAVGIKNVLDKGPKK